VRLAVRIVVHCLSVGKIGVADCGSIACFAASCFGRAICDRACDNFARKHAARPEVVGDRPQSLILLAARGSALRQRGQSGD
jgi:hypothetical protein